MIKAISDRFYSLKLQHKLITIFGTLISIFWLLEVVALSLNFEIYDQKLYYNTLQRLVFYSEKIDESIKSSEDLLLEVTLDPKIQDLLIKMNNETYGTSQYEYSKYLLKSELIAIVNDNEFIENFIYTDMEKEVFRVGSFVDSYDSTKVSQFVKDVNANVGPETLKMPVKDYRFYMLGRSVKDVKNWSLKYLGTLLMTYDLRSDIENKYQSFVDDSSMIFVYTEDGVIFKNTEKSPDLPKYYEKQGYKIVKYEGEKYLMCYHKSLTSELMYSSFVPYSSIYGQTSMMKTITNVVFTIVFIGMVFLARKISYTITSPLDNLHEAMEVVKDGDFIGGKNILLPKVHDDEIGNLVEDFEIMLNEIDYLINENYKKQILLKDTKYKMLQAQINPHFLYNTLNTVNWMVRMGETKETSQIIVNLGSLLRYSLEESEYVSIVREIEAIRHYISIQMFRYKKRVEFDIQTDGELDKYIMPKMILQPLVENSIYYGVENRLEKTNITVIIKEEESHIIIKVIDDGIGMNEDELEKVRCFDFVPKGHGIGLKNINERLSIKYNEDYKMNVNSKEKEGTEIEIIIPKILEDYKNV